MPKPSPRPFRVGDALVLLAAAALGVGGAVHFRLLDEQLAEIGGYEPAPLLALPGSLMPAAYGIAAIPLVALTAAVGSLRLAPPRPGRHLLWRQPGFLACAAVFFALAWRGASLAVRALFHPAGLGSTGPLLSGVIGAIQSFVHDHLITTQLDAGFAVAVVWVAAWGAGRWRAEPSWIDRAGRVLGVAWIGLTLMAARAAFAGS